MDTGHIRHENQPIARPQHQINSLTIPIKTRENIKLNTMLKKINLGLVALVLGFGLIFTTSAFTGKRTQTWRFNGSSTADVTDYTKYVLNGTPSENCQTVEAALPCEIIVDQDIDQPAELQSFMAGKTYSEIQDDYAHNYQPLP